MADIKLDDPGEVALQDEVGSRGDAARRANLGRAEEQVRLTGHRSEIVDEKHNMVDAVLPADRPLIGEVQTTEDGEAVSGATPPESQEHDAAREAGKLLLP